MKKISVIIPVYNGDKYINKSVDSVLGQTYQNIDIVVINDGSTDNTKVLLSEYGDKIQVINQLNQGLSAARNAGIKNATGDYLAFLDADDYWLPEKLQSQMAFMQANPHIGFCSTQSMLVNEDYERIGTWECFRNEYDSILEQIFIKHASIAGSGSSVIVKKEIQQQAGFFDTTLKSLEDIDMWLRYAAISDYGCVKKELSVILKRSGSMSGHLDTMRNSAIQVMKKNKNLLPSRLRNGFWKSAMARTLCDYAKWEYREQRKMDSLNHLLYALFLSPIATGRLSLSLLVSVVLNKPV